MDCDIFQLSMSWEGVDILGTRIPHPTPQTRPDPRSTKSFSSVVLTLKHGIDYIRRIGYYMRSFGCNSMFSKLRITLYSLLIPLDCKYNLAQITLELNRDDKWWEIRIFLTEGKKESCAAEGCMSSLAALKDRSCICATLRLHISYILIYKYS